MKVKEVICETLRLVGREEAAEEIEDTGGQQEENVRLRRALLTYLNAVRDELARGYFRIIAEQRMQSEDGMYPFVRFTFRPLEIKGVYVDDKPVDWHISPDYLFADGRDVLVKYAYAPAPLGLEDEFSYPDPLVSERLVEYGMIAEYYLVLGDASGSDAWENKYRNEIDRLLSLCTEKRRVPPRRWI